MNGRWFCSVALDLTDSKSTSGGMLYIFGDNTFVPNSWPCNKQTAVSRSSTEAEVISLDTSLRNGDVLEPPASRARGHPSRQLKSETSQDTKND